jgi:hypothetical protein
MAPSGGQSRLTIDDSETNSFFQALTIDGSLTRAPLSGSEERIHIAHDCLRETVAERLASWTTPRERVADLLEWLKDSLHAFVAVAPTVASASKLFDPNELTGSSSRTFRSAKELPLLCDKWRGHE